MLLLKKGVIMKRYTNKELRNLVDLGVAENLDFTDNEYKNKIEKENGYLNQIGYAEGVCGCSGGLLGAQNGKLFAITCRCQQFISIFKRYYSL